MVQWPKQIRFQIVWFFLSFLFNSVFLVSLLAVLLRQHCCPMSMTCTRRLSTLQVYSQHHHHHHHHHRRLVPEVDPTLKWERWNKRTNWPQRKQPQTRLIMAVGLLNNAEKKKRKKKSMCTGRKSKKISFHSLKTASEISQTVRPVSYHLRERTLNKKTKKQKKKKEMPVTSHCHHVWSLSCPAYILGLLTLIESLLLPRNNDMPLS